MNVIEKQERIQRAVLDAIKELDPPVIRIPANQSELRLIPLSENLDSLGMVNLIIGVEDALKKEFNQDVPILGRMSALGQNPFQTSGALMDYVDQII
ncbi:MAG: hypothetical protein JNN05_07390 [Candidatus Omnitrophica bacterium]|nr:hypothetical protein [Candidatus Omnitrophota bacterium]